MTLTTAEIDEARTRLEHERDTLEQRLGRFTVRPERGANLSFGKRIGDGTVEAIDRLNQIGVGNVLETKLGRVERALARVEAGTYGTCEVCGTDIDPRRLRAMPESTTCVSCPRPRD